jgi:hypothetical protein
LQVFISEQVLYSKADLERHYRTGDDAGPMAESGFKGHPICKFCKKRFYDADELYRHMENAHEHCFLCRKQNPHRFVYYKDYAELDGGCWWQYSALQYSPVPSYCSSWGPSTFLVPQAELTTQGHAELDGGYWWQYITVQYSAVWHTQCSTVRFIAVAGDIAVLLVPQAEPTPVHSVYYKNYAELGGGCCVSTAQ